MGMRCGSPQLRAEGIRTGTAWPVRPPVNAGDHACERRGRRGRNQVAARNYRAHANSDVTVIIPRYRTGSSSARYPYKLIGDGASAESSSATASL